MLVLEALQWDLSAVTPYSILDQILRSVQLESNPNESNVRKHAETFVALAATESHFIHKSPALIAVAFFPENRVGAADNFGVDRA